MSSRDKEKFYWWKKDKNYYSNHKIRALERKKNGYAYSVLLDKIKCESTPYGGILKFSETRAFSIEELSAVVDMPIKMVKAGLEALEELELIKKYEDGSIEIIDFMKCVGSETGQTVRKREKKEGGNSEVNFTALVPQESLNNTLESRDKSKSIEEYIYDYLSSSILTYMEAGLPKNDLMMIMNNMCTAGMQTRILPSKDRLLEILREVVSKNDSNEIFNIQGYLINTFKNEVNTYEYSRNDSFY